ncbi:MAG: DUF4290 domain-containing protein [Bacteroidetes bacterium]|nr:DUF4290 domain-containing protein [Bacteroidota bacterium]
MLDLEYNTGRNKLVISEYGRNIQKMIEHATGQEEVDKRNNIANELITLMGQLNPHLRDIADYKHKIYDHLFIISDYKLDIESPYPKPTPETRAAKPDIVPYNQSKINFRFYGKNIEQMIKKATELEDGPMKTFFINQIGSFMKSSCRTWNDEMLTDDQIWNHLKGISGGKIVMGENGDEHSFNASQQRAKTQHNPNNRNNQNNRNFRNNNNNQSNRNTGGENRNENNRNRNPNNPNNNPNNNRNNAGNSNNQGNGGNGNYRNFRNNKNRPV